MWLRLAEYFKTTPWELYETAPLLWINRGIAAMNATATARKNGAPI